MRCRVCRSRGTEAMRTSRQIQDIQCRTWWESVRWKSRPVLWKMPASSRAAPATRSAKQTRRAESLCTVRQSDCKAPVTSIRYDSTTLRVTNGFTTSTMY